jgi:acetyl-CoA carboxylase carboxyltransferase component
MGPQAAVNTVFYNKIQAVPEGPEREAFVAELREEYRSDVDLLKLASELVVDAVIPFDTLRDEISKRFAAAQDKREPRPEKKHGVPPV